MCTILHTHVALTLYALSSSLTHTKRDSALALSLARDSPELLFCIGTCIGICMCICMNMYLFVYMYLYL